MCVFSNVDTDVVLDVNGYDAVQSVARFMQPTASWKRVPA